MSNNFFALSLTLFFSFGRSLCVVFFVIAVSVCAEQCVYGIVCFEADANCMLELACLCVLHRKAQNALTKEANKDVSSRSSVRMQQQSIAVAATTTAEAHRLYPKHTIIIVVLLASLVDTRTQLTHIQSTGLLVKCALHQSPKCDKVSILLFPTFYIYCCWCNSNSSMQKHTYPSMFAMFFVI